MAINAKMDEAEQKLTISVEGRFDFSAHKEFRDSYQCAEGEPRQYQVDMASADYIDSSALGMLLVLRDRSGGDAANISIVNCSDEIKKIFSISRVVRERLNQFNAFDCTGSFSQTMSRC